MLDTIRNKLDDRGVSPVIGVILMVAITVILAAVIGSFVLGIGEDVSEPTQASLNFEEGDAAGEVIVNHNGGDSFTDALLTARQSGTSGNTTISLSPGGSTVATVPGLTNGTEADIIVTVEGQTVATGTVTLGS